MLDCLRGPKRQQTEAKQNHAIAHKIATKFYFSHIDSGTKVAMAKMLRALSRMKRDIGTSITLKLSENFTTNEVTELDRKRHATAP
jgi:hypothetical protein